MPLTLSNLYMGGLALGSTLNKGVRVSPPEEFSTDVIVLVAPAQSNGAGGSGESADATLDGFDTAKVRLLLDNASSVIAPNANGNMASQWGYNNAQGGNPAPAVQLVRDICDHLAPGKVVVLVPVANPSTSFAGANAWWASGSFSYTDAIDRLTVALGLYPGAKVICHAQIGETDAAASVSKATFKTAFSAFMTAVRGVSGAENAELLIGKMLMIPTSTYAKKQIEIANRELSRDITRSVFVGSNFGEYDSDGSGVHYSAAGLRQLGQRMARLQRHIAYLYANAPAAPAGFSITGSTYSFRVPWTYAHAYDLEVHDITGGPWRVYEVIPSEGVIPGDLVTGRVPGVRNVNVRMRAKSLGASGFQYSPYTATLQSTTGQWYWRDTAIQLDYTNDRAYVGGVAYASLAAAVTAGALSSTAFGHIKTGLSLASPFTLLASGVNPASMPASGALQVLAMIDDGGNNNFMDAGLWNISGTGYSGSRLVAAGSPITGNTSYLGTDTFTSALAVRHATRYEVGNYGWSANGHAAKTVQSASTVTGLAQLRTGGRSTADRTWQGTKGIIAIASVGLPDDELVGETA